MRNTLTAIVSILVPGIVLAQSSVSGTVVDEQAAPVEFANVIVYRADSTLAKVETTDESGMFSVQSLSAGTYRVVVKSLGFSDLVKEAVTVDGKDAMDLGILEMAIASVQLETAVVSATRAMVEIKPDRTVFNVQGTINSTGDNALSLLRKAPGVLVDNNNNISVLSRPGVQIYQDGKLLPLNGDELAAYLESLPAEQIDRIDIITNPGARYEAEGNAGIIDIRLKKDTSLGANGSVSGTASQGDYARGNLNGTANYRNKYLNVFGGAGYNTGIFANDMAFLSYQNGLEMDEILRQKRDGDNFNLRLGMDLFLSPHHTVGFLVNGFSGESTGDWYNRIEIGSEATQMIDSILVATNHSDRTMKNATYNVNYVYQNGNTRLNVDADYGRYRNTFENLQPNFYFDQTESMVTSEVKSRYDTPVEIDIYALKADYEQEAFGGTLGFGGKYSRVNTDNTFLFYDIRDGMDDFNERRSNVFVYTENVYAGYVNYARKLADRWNISAGLRLEQTDATGDLQAFLPELQEPPVDLNYLNAFPTAGITFQYKPEHTFSLNYGRRINRPDYNVLNPFEEQISELSSSRGNPFLSPEIVNNIEVGYTLKYRYNFKLSYSNTENQITRLIAPDDEDPRAGFITWENLANQKIFAANISLPFDITKWWSAYMNFSGSHLNNQADYGAEGIVDVQAWSYNIYQQHTFKLPWSLTGEISGWFNGPGVWGGVFIYETSWSLNLGLQRKFLQDQMTVRLSLNDIFLESGWNGYSDFNGLYAVGRGNWDSRRASLTVSMNFGNDKVKSRRRQTGLENEASRVGGEQ